MNRLRSSSPPGPRRLSRSAALFFFLVIALAAAPWARALERRDFAVKVLRRWAPSGWAVIERYEYTPWSYSLPGHSINLGKMDFMRYVRATTPPEMVAELPTAVHEICHSYARKMAWEMMATCHLPWRDSLALPVAAGVDVLVPLTPAFPCAAMASRIPQGLRDGRYRVYVISQSANQSTQSLGVYGLLEELCAYHRGTETGVELVGWARSSEGRLGDGLARLLQGVEGTYGARGEMKLFILAWLLEARASHMADYRAFMSNHEAVRAFVAIDEGFGRTIQRYSRLKAELAVAGVLSETDEALVLAGGARVISGGPLARRVADELAKREYVEMERAVREAAR